MDETFDIMDDVVDDYEAITLGHLLVELLTSPDRQLVEFASVICFSLLEIELALAHLEAGLLNFLLGDGLKVVGQAEVRQQADEPFGGVVMIRLDS